MSEKEKPNTTSKKGKHSSNKTESYYRTIFEQSPDGILIIDTQGKIIEFNEEACRHLGYSREEFSKLSISDIDSDQTPEDIEETIKRVLRDGRAEFEVRQRTKKGEIRNVLVITQVINLSGRIVFNCIWKDITDHRRADAALQASEKLYRLLAENSTDMVTRHLPDSTYLYVSPACRTLLGYEPEELMGTKAFDQMHPEDVKRVIALTQEAIRTGGTNMGQYRHRKKDGRYIWVETVGKVIKNAVTGNVEDIICVVRDVTERKRAEEELRKQNRTLRALNNSSLAMMRAKDETSYLNEVCRIIVEDCGHALVWIGYAEEDEGKTVRPVAFAGFDEGYIKSLNVTWADKERGRGPVGTAIRTGQPSVFRNMLSDPRFAPWREDALKRGYAAAVGLPLLADGRAFGSITIYSRDPDPFSDEEVRLLADLADDLAYGIKSIRLRTAHMKAEEALQHSEEHYRTLFENMLNGYAYCRMLYEDGVPQDFIYLDVNPAFEKLTGLKDVVGRKVSEVIPGIQKSDPELLEIYGRVALTGMPERIETYIEALDMWFWISVYSSQKEHFVAVFDVITERKKAEEALRVSDAELHDNYFTQAAINMILSESLQNITLEEILQKALNMILSIPWIAFEAIGSISLVEDDADVLVMKAYYGLPEPLKKLCAQIPFGKCVCGRAALTQKIEFSDHNDERHEICYEGMPPHGHYALPILFGGQTLGILNIYLKEGHIENQKEKEFLNAVADTLAGIIVRKKAEDELRESSRKRNTLTDNLPGFVYRCANDPNWTMEYLSEGVFDLTGYPAEEFIGNRIRSFASIIEPGDQLRIAEDVQEALAEKKPYTLEYRISTASGSQKWVWERGSGVLDDDKLLALEGFITDITERKMMEDRIGYLAYFDALTGLPNRNLFIDRISQGIARAEYRKRPVAVLTTDIDRFKFINDTYGLDTGDAVLKEVAKRLEASLREGDTAARIGGDGFGILLIDIAESEDVILVAEKVMKNVSQTIQFEGKEIVLTVSVGISVCPNDGKDASILIKNADLALAKAKQQGRKNYQFYTEELDVKASEFVLMEKNLFNAIKNGEFILYYQPYWDISTKKIVGMEALIRWQSPELGLVFPGKFIPVLEDTRMIIEVGEWVLRRAISQVKEWQNKGYPVVPVSVNLSLIQFKQKGLAEMVKKVIGEFGFFTSLLTLEITESAFMHDIESAHAVLENLKQIGVSISIDDFGTGYSSLAHLKRFPIDNLKIDMSFIREITTDPDTASIVMAIIAMAHTLNLKTIAEGIETEEQWKFLRLLRCDMGQGYYFSKPLPAEEAEKMLT